MNEKEHARVESHSTAGGADPPVSAGLQGEQHGTAVRPDGDSGSNPLTGALPVKSCPACGCKVKVEESYPGDDSWSLDSTACRVPELTRALADIRARIDVEIRKIEDYDGSGNSPGPLWDAAMVTATNQILGILRGLLEPEKAEGGRSMKSPALHPSFRGEKWALLVVVGQLRSSLSKSTQGTVRARRQSRAALTSAERLVTELHRERKEPGPDTRDLIL